MTFINPVWQIEIIQENILTNAAVRRIARAMITNSAFSGLDTGNPIGHQQFNFRQIRTLRRSQPSVDFDAGDNCR